MLVLALGLLAGGCDDGDPIEPTPPPPPGPLVLTAAPAPEWTALFDRDSGWTGADGIFSIPVSGDERPGTAGQTTTYFLFSDTVIGEVEADGSRAPGAKLINNTVARFTGGTPDTSRIEFFWRTDGAEPQAVIEPDTPEAQPDEWYWNQDGIVLGNTLHSFFLRLGPDSGGFAFEVVGVALVSFAVGDGLPTDVQQQETPLFRPDQDDRGNIQFGAGILANTAGAGAPDPDGYLYVYGVQNDALNKKLLVARVHPEELADFAAWRFWDGSEWNPSLDAAAPVTERISNELSVSPLADGRYLLVFQLDALSPNVAVRVGESPIGPWGEIQEVYRAPEVDADPDTFVYNAKAHPHLSAPGELLVSYNVNTFDFFGDFFADADIYRPRFIRLTGLPR
jgi:hypothetical protein